LNSIAHELKVAMALTGARTVNEIDRSVLAGRSRCNVSES